MIEELKNKLRMKKEDLHNNLFDKKFTKNEFEYSQIFLNLEKLNVWLAQFEK